MRESVLPGPPSWGCRRCTPFWVSPPLLAHKPPSQPPSLWCLCPRMVLRPQEALWQMPGSFQASFRPSKSLTPAEVSQRAPVGCGLQVHLAWPSSPACPTSCSRVYPGDASCCHFLCFSSKSISAYFFNSHFVSERTVQYWFLG